MERRLDHELLKRLADERHRLVTNGFFGQNYTAAIDAYRLAQESVQVKQVLDERNLSSFDPKRDYKELE